MRNEPVVHTHFVIEMTVKQVTHTSKGIEPGTGGQLQKMERDVEEVTRIVTKSQDMRSAITKARRLLDVEARDLPGFDEELDEHPEEG